MRHRKNNIRLGRKNTHRVATLKSLACAVLTKETITTTRTKAKEARSFVDGLITKAKNNTPESKREVFAIVRDKGLIETLFNDIAPRFKSRSGGYTRVIPLYPRRGDGSPMAILELVEKKPVDAKKPKKEADKKEPKPKAKEVKPPAKETPKKAEPVKPGQEPKAERPPAPKPKDDIKEEATREKARDEQKKTPKPGFFKNIRRYFRGKTP